MTYQSLLHSLEIFERAQRKKEVDKEKEYHEEQKALEQLIAKEHRYDAEKKDILKEMDAWHVAPPVPRLLKKLYTTLEEDRLTVFEKPYHGHIHLNSSRKGNSSYILLLRSGNFLYRSFLYRSIEQVCGWTSCKPFIKLEPKTIVQFQIDYLREFVRTLRTGEVFDFLQSEVEEKS